VVHFFAIWIRFLVFRQRIRGLDLFPKDGAVLVLGNHTAAADPICILVALKRPVHFMASEALFRRPRLGRFMRRIGTFPKAKYARDKESVGKMLMHNGAGRVVGMFPEGNRSWDGRTQDLQPGLGWLIKKSQGPVVFARNLTAWLLQPRWAVYPRWVPIQLELSEPFTFPEDWSTKQIEAEVRRRIEVRPEDVEIKGMAMGIRMALGLPAFLWACPKCLELDGLAIHPKSDNRVLCRSCGAGWRIDVGQKLHPCDGDAEPLTVANAHDLIVSHFGELPTVDADRFVADGVALDGDTLRVSRMVEDVLQSITEGPGTLHADAIAIGTDRDNPDWTLTMKEIKAVSVEVGNALQVRTNNELFQLDPVDGSPLKWGHFLAEHHARSRPKRRARRR
jgi:1-acyl-sn-glycerol-3-phosphate acyltransferase